MTKLKKKKKNLRMPKFETYNIDAVGIKNQPTGKISFPSAKELDIPNWGWWE